MGFLNTFKETAGFLAGHGKEFAKIAKLNVDLSGLERRLEKAYAAIGERIYNTELRHRIQDPELEKLYLEIGEILHLIQQKEKEKERIKDSIKKGGTA
ncbi:MAG TPA: hypothetical protein VNM22_12990 [Candidatus Limnocylindrales bacterium]|nr:hypothetical protein [Candidatus Limnocylindrales bacterium]